MTDSSPEDHLPSQRTPTEGSEASTVPAATVLAAASCPRASHEWVDRSPFEFLHERLDRDSDRVDTRLRPIREGPGRGGHETLADEIKGGLKTLRLVLMGVGILATL